MVSLNDMSDATKYKLALKELELRFISATSVPQQLEPLESPPKAPPEE